MLSPSLTTTALGLNGWPSPAASGGASNLSANQTIPDFTQTAAITAIVKIGATSQQIPDFTQTATVQALAKLVANQIIPDFTQTATVQALAKLIANQTIPDFTQTAAAKALAKLVANQQIPDFSQTGTLKNQNPLRLSADQVIPPFLQTAILKNLAPRESGGGIRRMSRAEIEAMRKREREIEQLQTELREGTKDAVMAALGSGPIAEDDALVALLLSMI